MLFKNKTEMLLLVLDTMCGIDLEELGEGQNVEMFEILPWDRNLKPIFTQK